MGAARDRHEGHTVKTAAVGALLPFFVLTGPAAAVNLAPSLRPTPQALNTREAHRLQECVRTHNYTKGISRQPTFLFMILLPILPSFEAGFGGLFLTKLVKGRA